MHILTTDLLTCPRCGPEFGLVVLAERLEDRLVREGRLGCPNCRESYPIAGGETDLRAGAAAAAPSAFESDDEWPFRMAALLGLAEGKGTVLVAGPGSARTAEIAGFLPDLMLVGGSRQPGIASGDTRLLLGERLPFRDGSLAGVVLAGDTAPAWVREAARVVAADRRLVLDGAGGDAVRALAETGLDVLLQEDAVVVASSAAHG